MSIGSPLSQSLPICSMCQSWGFIAADAADIGTFETTASIGIARWHAGEELDEALQRADAACYAAKDAGRNRVQAAA